MNGSDLYLRGKGGVYVADGGGVRIYGDTILEVITRLMEWLEARGTERAVLYGPRQTMRRRAAVLRSRGWDIVDVGQEGGHGSLKSWRVYRGEGRSGPMVELRSMVTMVSVGVAKPVRPMGTEWGWPVGADKVEGTGGCVIATAGVVTEIDEGVELHWQGGYVERETVGGLITWLMGELTKRGGRGYGVVYVRNVCEVIGGIGWGRGCREKHTGSPDVEVGGGRSGSGGKGVLA